MSPKPIDGRRKACLEWVTRLPAELVPDLFGISHPGRRIPFPVWHRPPLRLRVDGQQAARNLYDLLEAGLHSSADVENRVRFSGRVGGCGEIRVTDVIDIDKIPRHFGVDQGGQASAKSIDDQGGDETRRLLPRPINRIEAEGADSRTVFSS